MTLFYSLILGVFMGVGLCSSGRALAQVIGDNTSQVLTGVNTTKVGNSSSNSLNSAVIGGQLRFENMGYFAEVPDSPQLTRTQFVSGRVFATGMATRPWTFGYTADMIAGKFYSQRQTHWMINELSGSTRLSPAIVGSLGRKKQDWSQLDEYWQLGLWQPKYSLDALRPAEQGLTGLFLDYETENFQLLGFVTSISIPTLGPDVREEGGGLVADDRWYRAPSQSFTIGKNVKSIAYKIDRSDLIKLVKHEGHGLLARFGSKSKGVWFAMAGADKPVNDVTYTRNVVVPTGLDPAIAIVQPSIARHLILSTDLGYQWESGTFVLSALRDRPAVTLPEDEWVTQKLGAIEAYSVLIDWNLGALGLRSTQLKLGYLRVHGGSIEDIESGGQAADFTLFDQRLKFTNTVSFKVEGPLIRVFGKPLVGKWSYFYDWDQRGSLVGAELQLKASRDWMLLAGADVLGVEDENFKPNSFLNQYRANDRVYGGLTYVF